MALLRIVGLLAIAVLVWMAVSLLLSLISGWHVLAGAYRTQLNPQGKSIDRQSAYTRWLGYYGNCLMFTPTPTGVYIEPHFPFWIGHPPLEVPWKDIDVKKQTPLFVELRFRLATSVPFRISQALYEKLTLDRRHE